MRVTQGRPGLTGLAISCLSLAAVAIVSDAMVAVFGYRYWQAFVAAPQNAFVARGDDLDFYVASVEYAASSLIRYVALVSLTVILVVCRVNRTNPLSVASHRRLWLLVGLMIAPDAAYVAATWTQASPDAGWYLARTITAAFSAFVCAAIASVILGRHNENHQAVSRAGLAP